MKEQKKQKDEEEVSAKESDKRRATNERMSRLSRRTDEQTR